MPSACFMLITDDRFAPHCCATIASIARRHRDYPVVIVHEDLSANTMETIGAFGAGLGLDIRFAGNRAVDTGKYARFRLWPPAVWLKLHLHRFCPPECDRALYLDCDALLLRPVGELLACDMGGRPMAAVRDGLTSDHARKRGLGMAADAIYHNTGVLLIDIPAFRAAGISDRASRYALENAGEIEYIDQCAFNAAAGDAFTELDATWNCIAFGEPCGSELPHILHFAARKPWESFSVPGWEFYMHHRRDTPWPMPHDSARSLLRALYHGKDLAAQAAYEVSRKHFGARRRRRDIRRENRIMFRRWYRASRPQ